MAQLPQKILLHKKSRQLELHFDDQEFRLAAEYLRVHSPSAEVRGHGPGEGVLPSGKQEVAINGLEKAGNYALKITFDDGHDSGIYTWDYLYDLGAKQKCYWQAYLDELHRQGKSRVPDTNVVKFV